MAGQTDRLVNDLHPGPRLSGSGGPVHPVVLDRRIRDLLLVGICGVVLPAALALGVTLTFPELSLFVVLAIIVGVVGVVALMKSTHLEVTVAILAIYLGLFNGPVKLGIGAHEATAAVPDVLIGAVCLGAIMRLVVSRERIRMPPLSAWVLAFVGIVLLEAFNPKTAGALKALAGFRQQLQWVPFFFFAYLLMRSKQRLRIFFIIVGVCAVANAVVATYQTGLSPTQLAGWGPGYRALYQPQTLGNKASHARVYDSEGEARARPVGLGSDSGFSGGVGEIALPFSLALLATWRGRKRWIAAVFSLGSLAGILTGLGRTQVIGALLGVLVFIAFASIGGRQSKKPIVAVLIVAALTVPFGVAFTSVVRSGTFSRYSSLENTSPSELATHKAGAYTLIPHELSVVPFGVGLGTVGPVAGVGGKVQDQIENHGVSAETQYNLLADEVGAPGLIVWVALSLYFILVVVRGLRTIGDGDLAILLAGACAPFVSLMITGFTGPFETSAAHGPYFWFAIGIAAYWFAGRTRVTAPTAATADGSAPITGARATVGV
jgi:hypothetical protein